MIVNSYLEEIKELIMKIKEIFQAIRAQRKTNNTSYQDRLLKFLELKNKIIENKTGIKYIDVNDIKDVKQWDEELCKTVYLRLLNSITCGGAQRLARETCLWCIVDDLRNIYELDKCIHCNYGLRHDICCNNGSLYNEYDIPKVRKSFTNRAYRDMLQDIEILLRKK